MEVNTGYRASTRQSWKKKNVRDLVLSIIWENRGASRKGLVRLVVERLREDDEYLTNAGEYIVDLGLESLDRYEREKKRRSPKGRVEEAEHERKVKEATERATEAMHQRILYLNEIMPNGKRMRFCSGTEMVKMGEEGAKQSAAWVKIGKKAGTKLVGQALNEGQVKKIMGG